MSTPNRQRVLKRIHRRSHSVNKSYGGRVSEMPVTPALAIGAKTDPQASWNASFLPKGMMSKRMMQEEMLRSRNDNFNLQQENTRLKTRISYLENLLKQGARHEKSQPRNRKNSIVQSLRSNLQDLQEYNDTYQTQLTSVRDENHALRAELAAKTRQNEQLNQRISTQSSQSGSRSGERIIPKLQMKLTKAKQELNSKTEMLQKQEVFIVNLENQCQEYEKKLQELIEELIEKEQRAYNKNLIESIADDTQDQEVEKVTSLVLVENNFTSEQSADTTKPHDAIITSGGIDTSDHEYIEASNRDISNTMLDEYDSVIEDITKNHSEASPKDAKPLIKISNSWNLGKENMTISNSKEEILGHLAMRLQMQRIPQDDLAMVIFLEDQDSEKVITQASLMDQLRFQPFRIVNRQDQDLIIQFLFGNKEESTVKEIIQKLESSMSPWKVTSEDMERLYDEKLLEIGEKYDMIYEKCAKLDPDNTGILNFDSFVGVLKEMKISFEPQMWQYIKILFYSQIEILNQVPYQKFIDAYRPELLRAEELADLIEKIAIKLSENPSLEMKTVFIPDYGKISLDEFFRGIRELGIEIPEDITDRFKNFDDAELKDMWQIDFEEFKENVCCVMESSTTKLTIEV